MNARTPRKPRKAPNAKTVVDTALDLLGRFTRSDVARHPVVHDVSQKVLYEATRSGFRLAGATARRFKAVKQLRRSVRPAKVAAPDLFDLTPTEEQDMIRDSMARFAADRLRPAAAEANDRCTPPDELMQEVAELGTTLFSIPEELGGALTDRGIMSHALIAEALAHGDMGLAVACLAPAGVATALSEWGTPDQQSAYLSAFAGERPPAAALALLEPQSLCSPFDLQTTATTRGGDVVLDGVKALVPLAGQSELFLVAAQAHDGPGVFIVESDAKGLQIEAEPAMGIRAAGLGRLHLDGVRVAATAALRDVVYADLVHRARLAWSALACGTAQAVLDYVIPYCNERKAFGEPISHRQSVAFMISNIGIETAGMRLLTWRAAALAEQGKPFADQALHARQACVKHGMQIGNDGVQLLGGHGYTKEHPVERWYRDLRAIGVMEGGLLI